jgi:hypothetical protein
MSQKGQEDILGGIGRDGDLEENVVFAEALGACANVGGEDLLLEWTSGAVVQVGAEVR